MFKNDKMQKMYEVCRHLAADQLGEFWLNGKPRTGALHRSAYWKGRQGLPCLLWPRNSLAYAAWAAGRDDRREQEVERDCVKAWRHLAGAR